MIGGIIDSFVHDQSMLQRDEGERHLYHDNWNGGLFILFNQQNEDSNRSRNTCLESTLHMRTSHTNVTNCSWRGHSTFKTIIESL